MEFAHRLSYNPWHCIPEHRPLGNQNRARRRMYQELCRLRQDRNNTPHVEPTGDEVLESAPEDRDRGDAGRWEDQNGVTVFAAVRPEAVNELKRELAGLQAQVRADGKPFSRSSRIHYARFVFIPEAIDPALGHAGPALMYLADFDGPRERHLEEIARIAAAEFDRLGPFLVDAVAPTVAGRRQWLQDHVIPDATYYVNTIGRTVRQIRSEARLREAIEDFLDRTDISSQNPDALRAQIQDFVRDEPSLQWALKPVEDGEWRLRRTLARIAILLVAIPALIAALPALIVWVLAVRWHEKTETGEPPRPEPAHVAGLAEAEDRTLQNQFSALSFRKPAWIRLATPVVFLWLARFAVRYFFDRESIAGVKTIHFARWTFIDGRRRMLFTSNYDGSLESYMGDFIDIVAWGLNAVVQQRPRVPAHALADPRRRLERGRLQAPHPQPSDRDAGLVRGLSQPLGDQDRGERAPARRAVPDGAANVRPRTGCGCCAAIGPGRLPNRSGSSGRTCKGCWCAATAITRRHAFSC